ncbi:EAL domain-containing protein [Vibrio atypicus]|uniref:EAL domain-containing protein n=1 Tax=Vibrio atypicus TaxID=558271 RepID=UPI0037369C8D
MDAVGDNTQNSAALKLPKYVVYDWEMDIKNQTFICDEQGQMFIFGQVLQSLSVTKLLRLVPAQQRAKVKEVFQKVLLSGGDEFLHCCLLTPNSLFIYVELSISRIDEHHLKGTISPCLIVPSAHEAAEIFYSVFENKHHGVVVTDLETRILACNQYFEQMTGYLRNELVGLKTNIFNSSSHDDSHYNDLWGSVNQNGYWSGVLLSRHANGRVFPQNLTIHKIAPGNGQEYFIGFGTDLSSDLAQIEDIESGGVDLLTQLPTTDAFLEELSRKCDLIDGPNTLLVIAIQPNFDSEDSKALKQEFSKYLKDKTSALFVGYMDNGRFLACLPVSLAHPSQRVRDIAKSLTTFFHCFKHSDKAVYEALKNGLLGVSVYGADAKTSNRLISHACQAILELHSGESRRIAFYDREVHLQLERKKRIESHVKKVLAEENIEVYFQPIIDVKLNRIAKFEVLCRFPVLEGEVVSTQDYILVAEDTGKIVELDDLVCRLAFQHFQSLKAVFGEHVGLSINRSLNTEIGVVEVLKQTALALDKEGMPTDKLTIEFTESALLKNDEHSTQVLQMLRDTGVEVAVDDFGSGYASFQYLKEHCFDVLKIDRQFISDLALNTREYRIVGALIQLAHQLNLKVVAEGVETEEELNVVRELGADYVQGYLFAKPKPLNKILNDESYGHWPFLKPAKPSGTLLSLVSKHAHHLDPGDPLSLAYQYFEHHSGDYLPVVDGKVCVGLLTRSIMNLHMTPGMGTDLENNKERENWHKSVNRMMTPISRVIDCQTPTSEMAELSSQGNSFPWVLVDDAGSFKGLVEMKTAFEFFSQGGI